MLELAKRDSETARLLTARHVPISDADFRPIDKDARRKEFETEAAGWEAGELASPCKRAYTFARTDLDDTRSFECGTVLGWSHREKDAATGGYRC